MIIVTGAAGFIGSVIAKSLNLDGNKDLLLVDKFTKPTKWKNIIGLKFSDFIDRDSFLERLEKGEFKDVKLVIHMGACADTTEFDMNYLMHQNYEYSKRLCLWCLKNNVRFIYASSAAVYGDGSKGFSDNNELTMELEPLNPYGLSKLLFDQWLINTGNVNSVVGLRFFNVFGPNEYHKNKMSSIIYRSFPMAKKEGVVCLFKSYVKDIENGNQRRDFIYVKDVVSIVEFFIRNSNVNGIFNVGTGKARSFNDLATSLLTAMNKKTVIEYFDMPEEIRNKYQYFTEADISKLIRSGYNKEFGSMETVVRDYVQNYLSKEHSYY
jgi:ADP-L-glycero-D-manno-heptose 6-epimerase